MSLLGLAAALGGAALGFALGRLRRTRRRAALPPAEATPSHRPLPRKDERWFPVGLDLRPGDVLVRAGGEEAWLESALVLIEDRPTGVLFFAPEAFAGRQVYARPDAAPWWLVRSEGELALPPGEPPATAELEGARFTRRRRLPVAFHPEGAVPLEAEGHGVLAEYDDGAERRLLLLYSAAARWAFVGVALAPGLYDVLPGPRRAVPR